MKQNNKGFSLVEVVVAIAILGAFSVSICTSLVLSLRMNEKTNALMMEQQAVSSAVETLMASGYNAANKAATEAAFTVSITENLITDNAEENNALPYCSITVASESVSVTTQIRKVAEVSE